MLKLRKVELLGFKSFCEKTQITFSGTGITCIVGPNGCGKSNIVDAISWVLGEQSHKSLRAERMSDCISNGTAKRPPMGMAEVSLTLVDPELAEAAARVLERAAEEESAAQDSPATDTPSGETPSGEGIVLPGAETPSAHSSGGDPPQAATFVARKKRAPEKPAIHLKPGEVVIGRRLYRSGQSEYMINGRVARLRDIQELFMGMGLGPDSYAIIEQGRIGQILSSKPMERRAILEEAAGISKYKTKKRLAEAKLESSKLNLSRVNDILVEVEKQLGSLKRQASKARRYAELREQMRGLLRLVLASKARELDAEEERLASQLSQFGETEDRQAQSLRERETEQERLNARNYELDAELRQNQNLLGQTALELDRAENRVVFNRERIQELDTRLQQLVAESAQLDRQAADQRENVKAQQASVTDLRKQNAKLEHDVTALAARTQALVDEQQTLEARVEELRLTAGHVVEEIARLQAERAHAEEAALHYVETLQREEQSAKQGEVECAALAERAGAADAHWQKAETQSRRLDHELQQLQERQAGLRRRQQETSASSDRARESLARARARRSSLEQILVDRSYTADAVQKLFAANGAGEQHGFRAVGVLADYAEVEQEYESAVEQFLRDELEYVVVETFDHARAGIALLRGEVGGRATFFVDSLRNLKAAPGEPIVPFQAEPGLISRLDRLLNFRDPLGAAAKPFLPRLQSAFLVETAAVAERLAREHADYHFVTLDGVCYHGRLVSGGRPGEAGPLALKREVRQLESETLRLEKLAEQAQAELDGLESELKECERSLDRTHAEHVEAARALVAATHRRDQATTERERATELLEAARKEIARLHAELESARARAEQARDRQATAVRSRAVADQESAQGHERLAALRLEIQAMQERLSTRRAELATLTERLASAEVNAQSLEEESRELRQRAQELLRQQAAMRREKEELLGSTGLQQREIEGRRAEKVRLEKRKEKFEQEWEQLRTHAAELEEALRTMRHELSHLREQRGQLEIERARNDSDREHLRQTCQGELNAQPEELVAQATSLVAGEELAASETNYREMKARVEAMGPVNMMALEEFQECEKREEFLSRERDDLVQSIADTQQAIAELDEVSRQKFEQAFAAINANFAEAFRALFGGGTGEMRLGEPDSSGEAGLDVVAQPPGKRLQNVLLLSGGEKAMTALALLIAIFRYQPSPFCILDEVDAPLDEANVSRFNRMLQEMGEQTQFLIVTHNRRTMEMAPVLYGVTMQEPGVSKLVSVRWDEPKTNAA